MAADPPPPEGGSFPGPSLVVALFLCCALCWSLVIPPFESPDEIGHARYVNFLRAGRRLPVPGEGASGEAHQPPLYYVVAAAVAAAAGWEAIDVSAGRNRSFVWYGGSEMSKYIHPAGERPPLRGSASTLHRLRLLSVLMGAGTVWLIRLMALRAGATPATALIASALAAFTPQFTFIAASLNNDNLANLASAACLCALIGAVGPAGGRGRRLWMAAGCAAGVALLAKFTAVTLLGAGALAILMTRREGLRARAAAFFLPALALPAPLLAWNAWRWGDPMGLGAQLSTLPQLVDRKPLLSAYFVTEFPVVLARSFWGTFGWMSFPMPGWLDLAFAALLAIGGIGLAAAVRRRELGAPHLLAGAAVLMQLAQVVIYNLTFTQAQGRFLFPVIGPIMLLLAGGLRSLAIPGSSRVPHAAPGAPRLHPSSPLPGARGERSSPAARLALVACLLMASANLALLWLWVAPAYGP